MKINGGSKWSFEINNFVSDAPNPKTVKKNYKKFKKTVKNVFDHVVNMTRDELVAWLITLILTILVLLFTFETAVFPNLF